ncbi:MAG: P-loop NTPase fold protein [Planctomycetota bacterium]
MAERRKKAAKKQTKRQAKKRQAKKRPAKKTTARKAAPARQPSKDVTRVSQSVEVEKTRQGDSSGRPRIGFALPPAPETPVPIDRVIETFSDRGVDVDCFIDQLLPYRVEAWPRHYDGWVVELGFLNVARREGGPDAEGLTRAIATLVQFSPTLLLVPNARLLNAAASEVGVSPTIGEDVTKLFERIRHHFRGSESVTLIDADGSNHDFERIVEWAKDLPLKDPEHARLESVAGWVLNDAPIDDPEQDKFGYRDIARALHGIINEPDTGTPLVMAINAPWGAGKSSLGRLVFNLLRPEDRGGHRAHWFNAWMHDDATSLPAAIVADVARAADRHRPMWRRMVRPLPGAFLSPVGILRRRIAFFVLIVASGAAIAAGLSEEQVHSLAESVGLSKGVLAVPGTYLFSILSMGAIVLLLFKAVESCSSVFRQFVLDPSKAAERGQIATVRDQLHRLIREATPEGQRFVLFIDDLERCRPPKAVDVLEAVNQLVAVPDSPMVVVLMADMPAIAAHVEIKYETLAAVHDPGDGARTDDDRAPAGYGKLYLQKIIQLQHDLPRVEPTAIREYISDLAGTKTQTDPAEAAEEEQSAISTPWDAPLRFTEGSLPLGAVVVGGVTTSLLADPLMGFLPNWLIVKIVFFAMMFVLLTTAIALLTIVPLQYLFSRARARYLERARVRSQELLQEERDARGFAAALDPNLASQSGDRPALSSLEKRMLQEEQRRLVTSSDSKIVRDALAAALPYAPVLPRNAKRLLNKLRLTLLLTQTRALLGLGDQGDVSPAQVGKWVGLQESWPELADALRRDPESAHDLESAAATDPKRFNATIESLAPSVRPTDLLIDLFKSAPRIAEALPRLVRLPLPEQSSA